MKLANMIQTETADEAQELLFIRHSNRTVDLLERCGVSIHEYTEIQPKDTKFDYWHKDECKTKIIVVIVNDKVWGVYTVLRILDEDWPHRICSSAYLDFLALEGKKVVKRRKFELSPVNSSAVGKSVRGWEGKQRTTVSRSSGSFFMKIEVDV